MQTFSYLLMIVGTLGLALVYFRFPSIRELRVITRARKRILGLSPYFVLMAAAHALALGAAIQLVYFLLPDHP